MSNNLHEGPEPGRTVSPTNRLTPRPSEGPTSPNPGSEGTRVRRLEAEIEVLREQVRLLSYQASMAEVANSALHNLGNVINSINVSAALLGEGLRHSRVANLGKGLALLRENSADLARFLCEDPKGKMLPGYLETLADHLAAEHVEMMRETEALCRGLEHAKEIVAVQQSYARQGGLLETLEVSNLVQDAIRMNLGAFERHGVTIVREFSEVPPVTVERHKVLQILMNLLRNAKYALDQLAPATKQLTIGINSPEPGRVLVTVRDNGVGIPPENLARLFDYGFTTKPDGHGFGLHSSSLAAKEIGGRLTVRSEGLGKGASFCLELPAAAATVQNEPHEHGNRIRANTGQL